MSPLAFALVILAGLIHASWNIVAKKADGDARFVLLTSVLMLLVWAPLGLWQGVLQLPHWGWRAWACVSLGSLLHVAYFIVLLRGYRQADLTVVYPVARGSGPLLSSLVALSVLGERISASGLLGMLGVVLGVFLIAGGPGLLRTARHPAQRARLRTGLFYGGWTGLCIASYTVVDAYAVKVLLLSPILVDYMSNMLRIVVLSPVGWQQRHSLPALWRSQWRHALLIAIVSPMAYVLVLYAMQRAPLSHVAPAREISMLFAALMGGRLLGEGDRGLRILGALLIGFGVMLLGL
jgi:uncharacterized membrane protein